jgi:hypothetical protein
MCRPKARAVQVDAHKSAVLLIRIVHRLEAIGHPGIIHEYVDAAVLCDYGIGKAADRAGISHVERLELRAVARLSKRTSGRAAVFLDNFRDDHRGACLCQGARDFEADAPSGAGDNRNSILQTEFLEIHRYSSLNSIRGSRSSSWRAGIPLPPRRRSHFSGGRAPNCNALPRRTV